MTRSLAQFEVESLAWINIAVALLGLPLFGVYIYFSIEGADNLELFLLNDPRGQYLIQSLVKLFFLLILWIPMSVGLKLAASRRDQSMLKCWNIFQVILIFVVALHLLVQPPRTLITVFAYTICFAYFLISLWICETLVEEIKEGNAGKFVRMDSQTSAAAEILTAEDDNNNNTILTDSIEFRNILEDRNSVDDMLSIQMKKVLSKPVL